MKNSLWNLEQIVENINEGEWDESDVDNYDLDKIVFSINDFFVRTECMINFEEKEKRAKNLLKNIKNIYGVIPKLEA